MAKKSGARKTSEVPSRIWTFGCDSTPSTIEGLDKIKEQITLYDDYYNALVENERKKREEYRALREKCYPRLTIDEAELDRLVQLKEEKREEIKKSRQATRKNTSYPKINAEISELKLRIKELRTLVKDDRVKAKEDPVLESGGVFISEKYSTLAKEIRSQFVERGLYWGNYLQADNAFKSSLKGSMDPEPKHRFGEGRVGVQIQGKKGEGSREFLTTTKLFNGGSNFIKIEKLPESEFVGVNRRTGKEVRRAFQHRVYIAVGQEHRKPIWVSFRVAIHRPIPDGVVKWAWIKVSRVGLTWKYDLQLTLESNAFRDPDIIPAGAIAIKLGYRRVDAGIRFAVGFDTNGKVHNFFLDDSRVENDPNHLLEDVIRTLPDELKNVGDKCFNEARDELLKWFFSNKYQDWMSSHSIDTLRHWRSHKRMAHLAGEWANRVFHDRSKLVNLWISWKQYRMSAQPKPLDLFPDRSEGLPVVQGWLSDRGVLEPEEVLVFFLELWRRKNKHIYQWESNQRDKAINRRRDLFRCISRRLVNQYGILYLKDSDLTKVAKKAKPEEESVQAQEQRSLRTTAAPSHFRMALTSAFGPNRTTKLSPSVSCCNCGNTKIEQSTCAMTTCPKCHEPMDQDERIVRNLLREGLEGGVAVGVARAS